MKVLKNVYLAILLLVYFSAHAVLADEPGVQLKTEAFQEVEVVSKTGQKTKKMVPILSALPAQEVIYVLSYKNMGKKPAEKVVINNPIPDGLVFQPGSAQGEGTTPEVSVDGGLTFATLEKLKVGGLPAKATDVTNVHWVFKADIKPDAEGKVIYRGLVK